MRLIGIDPSLTSTGFAYTDKNGDIHTGRILPKNMRGPERLYFIKYHVGKLLDDLFGLLGGPVQSIIYEDYAMGGKTNKGRLFSIGELGGVLKTLAWERGMDVLLVPPSSLKLFATGKGNADKEEVMDAIAKRYSYSVTQNDEADAFILMKMGQLYYSGRSRVGSIGRGLDGCTLIEGSSYD